LATVTVTAMVAGSVADWPGVATAPTAAILPPTVLPSGSVTVAAAPRRASRCNATSRATCTTRRVPV